MNVAKTSTRLEEFFEGNRLKCRLQDFHVLLSKGNERRIKLSVTIPLSEDSYAGMPEAISEQLELMVKEKSTINFAKVDVNVELANVRIFTTDAIKRPIESAIGATLEDFKMVGEGVDEDRTVDLNLAIRMPGTEGLRDWCWNHLHSDFFIEVQPQQPKLEESKTDEKEEKSEGNGRRPRQATLM